MKCSTCGNNLQLEDVTCPFCGSANPYFVQHQEDMAQYKKQFHTAKQAAEKRSLHFRFWTAKITVLAVLVVVNLVGMILATTLPYELWKQSIKRDLTKNYQVYYDQMMEYEKEGNWEEMIAFYEAKNLGSGGYDMEVSFREFMELNWAANEFCNLESNIMELYGGAASYMTEEYYYERIAASIVSLWERSNRDRLEEKYIDYEYPLTHLDAFDAIREDGKAIIKTYLHFTDEEIAELENYSEKRIYVLIEERMGTDEE